MPSAFLARVTKVGAAVAMTVAALGAACPASASPIIYPLSSSGPVSAFGINADGSAIAADIVGERPGPGGATLKAGVAVSGDGTTTVVNAKSPIMYYDRYAVKWRGFGLGGATQYIPPDHGGMTEGFALSGDGSVAVGRAYYSQVFLPTPPKGSYAVRYTTDGGGNAVITILGDLPGGAIDAGAFGVSGDGTITVGYGSSALGREAFRHTDALGMVPLGDLSGGIFASQANAISTNGTYIVGYGNSVSGQEAFRIVGAGGPMTGLGDLPGGGFASEAKDVSDDGAVVVGGGTTAAGAEAFYWTESDGMARLWDVLLANGLDPATQGWASLTVANGVTADGLTVVGNGTLTDGTQRGFIATIPEPTAVGLLAWTAAALLGRRRRTTRVA